MTELGSSKNPPPLPARSTKASPGCVRRTGGSDMDGFGCLLVVCIVLIIIFVPFFKKKAPDVGFNQSMPTSGGNESIRDTEPVAAQEKEPQGNATSSKNKISVSSPSHVSRKTSPAPPKKVASQKSFRLEGRSLSQPGIASKTCDRVPGVDKATPSSRPVKKAPKKKRKSAPALITRKPAFPQLPDMTVETITLVHSVEAWVEAISRYVGYRINYAAYRIVQPSANIFSELSLLKDDFTRVYNQQSVDLEHIDKRINSQLNTLRQNSKTVSDPDTRKLLLETRKKLMVTQRRMKTALEQIQINGKRLKHLIGCMDKLEMKYIDIEPVVGRKKAVNMISKDLKKMI